MNSVKAIILCEGETDQALLGIYLEGISNYKFFKKSKVAEYFSNEQIQWYKNDNEKYIGIWNNGGNIFDYSLIKIADREKMEHSIEHVIIVTDHDDERSEKDIPRQLAKLIEDNLGIESDSDGELIINGWLDYNFKSGFGDAKIRVGYLLVPIDQEGALETFMINALSETKPEQETIIRQAKIFLDGLQTEIYLQKRREKTKAVLGVSLSVFNPDRIVTTMKELIDQVDWTKFDTSKNQFEMFHEFL